MPRKKERQLKIMPIEVRKELSQVERCLAYYSDGYELDEQDAAYLDQLDQVFKIIHGQEDRDEAREKIKHLFELEEPKQIKKIIEDTMAVYGDFFTMSKEAMRIIQEKRHTRIYMGAVRNGEYASANKALKAIDDLYDLYKPDPSGSTANTRLPRVLRTTDPAALATITNEEDE